MPPRSQTGFRPQGCRLSPPGIQREQRIWRPITPLIGRLFLSNRYRDAAKRQIKPAATRDKGTGSRKDPIDTVKHETGNASKHHHIA